MAQRLTTLWLIGAGILLSACAGSVPAPASWSEREGNPCVTADHPIRMDGLRCFEADHDGLPLLSLVQASALEGAGTLAAVGTFEGTLVLGSNLTLVAARPSAFVAVMGPDLRPVSGVRLDLPGEIVAFPPSCMGSALLTVDEDARGRGPFLTRLANGNLTLRRDLGLVGINVLGAACDPRGEIYLRFAPIAAEALPSSTPAARFSGTRSFRSRSAPRLSRATSCSIPPAVP